MSNLSELFDMLARVSGDDDWMQDALCAQTDPDMFFPELGDPAVDARTICGTCPVRDACLEYAIRNGITHGIWGGLSPRQRVNRRWCVKCGDPIPPRFRYCTTHGAESRRTTKRAYDQKRTA